MIKQFPDEILRMIFNELQSAVLKQCQKVCRGWYPSAHIASLSEVQLSSATSIQQFIAYIDQNSKPKYLYTVKKLNIGVTNCILEVEYMFNRESIEKLCLRFPNIEEIRICATMDSFAGFDEDICELILTSCPKLKVFEVRMDDHGESQAHLNVLHKLRSLLTSIDVPYLNDGIFKNTEFIANFPRLQKVSTKRTPLEFEGLLPVLGRLPHLRAIRSPAYEVLDEDVIRSYSEDKPIDVRIQCKQQLANLTDISLTTDSSFTKEPDACRYLIDFISSYLTNLQKFSLQRSEDFDWDSNYKYIFHGDILSLVTSAQDSGEVGTTIDVKTLSSIFSDVTRTIYQDIPAAYRHIASRVLNISIRGQGEEDENASAFLRVESKRKPFTRSINIRINSSLISAMDTLLKLTRRAAIAEVDTFTFRTTDNPYAKDYNSIMQKYEDVLTNMPSLKRLVFYIPAFYKEFRTTHYIYNKVYKGLIHPQVQELTLCATPALNIQSMLNRYSFTFPSLKHLALHHFSGTWHIESGEFRVILARYSLESLEIDMTPVRIKTLEYLTTQSPLTRYFFVLELETLINGEKQLYKVSLDLSSVTRTTDNDLKGFVRGIHYFKVFVSINNVDRIELCMEINGKEGLQYVMDRSLKRDKRVTIPLCTS